MYLRKANDWYKDAMEGIAEALHHMEKSKDRNATEVAMRMANIVNERRVSCLNCLREGHTWR
jgi:hypothetical protein